jgi:hypothetical protein
MPKPKQDGFDPRLVALGAIGGGIAGRRATNRLADRSVSRRSNEISAADLEMNGPRGRSAADIATSAAQQVADYEYSRMPRVNDAKLSNYRGMISQGGNDIGKYDQAARLAGLSDKEIQKYYNKSDARREIKYGRNSAASQLESAASLRANRKRTRNTVKGGIGGAALAALVQLVAKELNKK